LKSFLYIIELHIKMNLSEIPEGAVIISRNNNISNKEYCINTIEDFIKQLRDIRRDEIFERTKKDVVDRDNREQWPSTSVLKAYKEGKINKFKIFTENYAGDSPEDPKWIKRWNGFIKSLKDLDDADATKKISAFMAAQRKKKYDRSKR
jgi:hypothetical protein